MSASVIDPICPECGSSNTQKIDVLVDSASRSSTFTASSVGYSNGGIGIASHQGSSASTTHLAMRLMPGPRPSDETGVLLTGSLLILIGPTLFAALFASNFSLALAILICVTFTGVLLIVSFYIGRRDRSAALAAWRTRRDYLESAWFCHRCGKDWAPPRLDRGHPQSIAAPSPDDGGAPLPIATSTDTRQSDLWENDHRHINAKR